METNDVSAADPLADFIDAAVWHGTLERSDHILAARPAIAQRDIYAAAILGDDGGVRRFLAAHAASATAKVKKKSSRFIAACKRTGCIS